MLEERELLREYSRASVWPSLELTLAKGHNTSDGSIKKLVLTLTNNGVGPAIVTDVSVTYRGKSASDWWHLFKLQEVPDSIETYISNRSVNGQVIKIGEAVELLNLNDNIPLARAFYERSQDLSIEIYYESIYKEKWLHNGENTIKLDNYIPLPEANQFR